MRNTPYNPLDFHPEEHPGFDRELHIRRTVHVMEHALTPKQHRLVRAYYFEGKSLPAIAREMGINRVSAWRLLKRAEGRMRRYLQY